MQSLVVTSPSAYDAAKGAHAIAILTEWDEFKNLDYDKIYDLMAKPVRLTHLWRITYSPTQSPTWGARRVNSSQPVCLSAR